MNEEEKNKQKEAQNKEVAEDQSQQDQSSGEYDHEEYIKQQAVEVLKSVYDPEIPVDIYELGLIYEIKVYPVNNLYVQMTLTSPSCPVAGTLPGEVETKLGGIRGVSEVNLDLVFDPPWDMSKMSEEAKLELGLM
ncbi:MAG: FeS assembly SUF system protein [Bacteroidetes bacterium SW_10_40_5]|nr:MAG: FeS assembly SUF system protein [Bacteroidetes bacterium SW_10_40_5]